MAIASAKIRRGPSPFHRGEQEIQVRVGVRERIEELGQRVIRDCLPDQHREFYAQLPFLLLGTLDKRDRPWASVLAGRPGFVRSPDPYTLKIGVRPIYGDPLNENIVAGADVGILGIEFHSRRRNRAPRARWHHPAHPRLDRDTLVQYHRGKAPASGSVSAVQARRGSQCHGGRCGRGTPVAPPRRPTTRACGL